jgi:hypothetical protein
LHGNEGAFRRLKKVGSAYSSGLTIHPPSGDEPGWRARTAHMAWERRSDVKTQLVSRFLEREHNGRR